MQVSRGLIISAARRSTCDRLAGLESPVPVLASSSRASVIPAKRRCLTDCRLRAFLARHPGADARSADANGEPEQAVACDDHCSHLIFHLTQRRKCGYSCSHQAHVPLLFCRFSAQLRREVSASEKQPPGWATVSSPYGSNYGMYSFSAFP